GFRRIGLFRRDVHEFRGRRSQSDCAAGTTTEVEGSATATFDGENVSFVIGSALLNQGGIAFRQASPIECFRQLGRPRLMKVVVQPGGHTGPIVERHCWSPLHQIIPRHAASLGLLTAVSTSLSNWSSRNG